MPSAAIEALPAGTTNVAFRIATPEGEYVVRLHDLRGNDLGADHVREARLQAVAAQAGIAPAIVYADPTHRFMITEFVRGSTWRTDDMGHLPNLQRLGATLQTLHGLPIPAGIAPYDLATTLAQLHARLTVAAPGDRVLFDQLLEQAQWRLIRAASGERASTVIHSDLHHTNIVEAGRLVLIDWEYAMVADPLYDLACVLAYYPGAAPHAGELLKAAGLQREASVEMLDSASWLYLLLGYWWYRAWRLGAAESPAEPASEREMLERLAAGAGIRLPRPAD